MKNFKLILQKSLLNKKVAESYLNPALDGLFLPKMMFLGQKHTFHFSIGARFNLNFVMGIFYCSDCQN